MERDDSVRVRVGNHEYDVRVYGKTVRLSVVDRPDEWFEMDGTTPEDAARTLGTIEYRYPYMRR
jgi:hypothetical protein